MITVHHLETSRSHRVLWLLEELGVPYELRLYRRDPRTRLAPPELKAIHPLGKSPVVTEGDDVIAESGAILEYLAERYGAQAPAGLEQLVPATGTPAHRQGRFWMHYAEGSLMNWLVMKGIRQGMQIAWPRMVSISSRKPRCPITSVSISVSTSERAMIGFSGR